VDGQASKGKNPGPADAASAKKQQKRHAGKSQKSQQEKVSHVGPERRHNIPQSHLEIKAAEKEE